VSANLLSVPDTSLPSFTQWPSFPFEGELRVRKLDDPVAVEPPRTGEEPATCPQCKSPDTAYIWVDENWRVRSLDRPGGLPMVLILESRSHLDLGDLPNMLAAELGVMIVRLERAIRSLDGVARVHVNRWGDGAAHLHLWFLARPRGRLQLRGSFLPMWDEILPPVSEHTWRENLALVAAWLADFGGQALAEPPRIQWQAPSSLEQLISLSQFQETEPGEPTDPNAPAGPGAPASA
jgi:diadenosine tetraphosphate (Ap4A) HIT family hydrolase